ALALVQEVVRLLTRTPPGEGDFEIIRLKNASATQAARILDEAFNGPRQPQGGLGAVQQPGAAGAGGPGAGGGAAFFGRFGGFGGFGRGAGPGLGGLYGERDDHQPRPTLSVGVDERSNSIILACPQSLYDDIKKLVEHLESAAKDSVRTVRVVSVKGVDPVL